MQHTLANAQLRTTYWVTAVIASPDAPEWATWLNDLGFRPLARVSVLMRAAMGGDPLLVRIGSTSFALRKAEAECIFLADAHKNVTLK
jgi:ferrous iron transport protein A